MVFPIETSDLHMIADLNGEDWGKVALWGGLTVLSVVVFFVAIHVMRRKFGDSSGANSAVFDLEELQQMRNRGDINDSEYKVLRSQAIDSMMLQNGNRQSK